MIEIILHRQTPKQVRVATLTWFAATPAAKSAKLVNSDLTRLEPTPAAACIFAVFLKVVF